jgi:hypothetical protein
LQLCPWASHHMWQSVLHDVIVDFEPIMTFAPSLTFKLCNVSQEHHSWSNSRSIIMDLAFIFETIWGQQWYECVEYFPFHKEYGGWQKTWFKFQSEQIRLPNVLFACWQCLPFLKLICTNNLWAPWLEEDFVMNKNQQGKTYWNVLMFFNLDLQYFKTLVCNGTCPIFLTSSWLR